MNMRCHPGEIIRQRISSRGWKQADLAFMIKRNKTFLNRIITGKIDVSFMTSQLLGLAFDEQKDYFFNLQQQFNNEDKSEPDKEIQDRIRFCKQFPVRQMVRKGWLDENLDLESALKKFFNTNDLSQVALTPTQLNN